MSRILKAYETRFRWLLQQARARRLDQGVARLVDKARQISASEGISLANALTQVCEWLSSKPPFRPAPRTTAELRFFCDAGLGGLARWLRAAGYEARWVAGIDDDVLLQEAAKNSETVLTTDSMLMERRVVRERIIPALWLPPTMDIPSQLKVVFRELNLRVLAPRCMSCGGPLRTAHKESLRERIPPKTYRWLDEYFVCSRCGKLFWHGTHWNRIATALAKLQICPQPNQAAAK
jgi:uncharacterized protein